MIKIKISFLTPFSDLTRATNEQIELCKEPTLNELLNFLSGHHGIALSKYFYNSDNQFEPKCLILINKIHSQDPEKIIKNGDEITLAPLLVGG